MMKASSEDQTPYLRVGTEVSAKYRGAFCEAKVKQVDPCVKCKVAFKEPGLGTKQVDHTALRGGLDSIKLNADVEVSTSVVNDAISHGSHSDFLQGTLTRVTDASVYLVVFNDGDERTLRRTQLVLKGDKHFEESSTLDQLPLHNPEQFGTPVINRRRHRVTRNRDGTQPTQECDDSGSESGHSSGGNRVMTYNRRLAKRVGEIVRVGEDGTTNSVNLRGIPCLVVVPSAYPNLEVHPNQLLMKSYRDNKFYVMDAKLVSAVNREELVKDANASSDKGFVTAVERALLWLDSQELPHSWSDHETLFGVHSTSNVTDDVNADSCDSDTGSTTQEQRDHWLAMLFNFMDSIGSPINKVPTVANKDLDLYRLSRIVRRLGGSQRVSREMKWSLVAFKMRLPHPAAYNSLRTAYSRYLQQFEDFTRKLGSESMSFPSSGRRSSTTSRGSATTPLTPRERRISQSSETDLASVSTPTGPAHRRKPSISKEEPPAVPSGAANLHHSLHSITSKEKRPNTLSLSSSQMGLHKGVKKKGRTPTSMLGVASRRTLRKDVADKFEDKPKEKSKVKARDKGDAEKGECSFVASHDTRKPSSGRGRKPADSGRSFIGSDVLVRCIEGGQDIVYKARITQAENQYETPRFNVHYKGWKKRYDEWIERDRIVEFVSESAVDQDNDFDDSKEESDAETPGAKESEGGMLCKVVREKQKCVQDEESEAMKMEPKLDKVSDSVPESSGESPREMVENRTRRRKRHGNQEAKEEPSERHADERAMSNNEEIDEIAVEHEQSVTKLPKCKSKTLSKREEALMSRRSKRYLERTHSRDTITSCATSGSKSTHSNSSVAVKSEPSSDEDESSLFSRKTRARPGGRKGRRYDHARKSKSDDEAITVKQEPREICDDRESSLGSLSRASDAPIRSRRRRRQGSDLHPAINSPNKRLRREAKESLVSSSVSSPLVIPEVEDSGDSDSADTNPPMRLTRERRREAEVANRRLDVISGQEEVVSKTDCPSTPSTDGMRDDKENACIEIEEADIEDATEEDDEVTEEEEIDSVEGGDVEENEAEDEEEEEEMIRSSADTDDFEEMEENAADSNAHLQESSTDEASSSVADGSPTGRHVGRHRRSNKPYVTRNRRRTVSNASVSSKEPVEPPSISPELPPPTLSRLRPFVRPTPSFIPANLDRVESYEEREKILVNSIKACQKRWREVKQEMRELDRVDAQRRAKRRRRKSSQQPPVLSAVYPPNVNVSRSNATTPDSAPPVAIVSSS